MAHPGPPLESPLFESAKIYTGPKIVHVLKRLRNTAFVYQAINKHFVVILKFQEPVCENRFNPKSLR